MATEEGSVDGLIDIKDHQNCCLPFCSHCSQETETTDSNISQGSNEDISLCEENDEDKSHHEFEEGGWSWVIVFASFFNSFIFDGIGSSYGVLYPYIVERFQASAFLSSFGGSMFSAYLIMGSVAAALIKKFGFRAVSVAGGLLSCIGLVAASYSSNIYLFILTYGVIGGAAVGFVYLPSMVIVNSYFNKKRGITNGIISSGSGMGLLVMAPLINCILDEYSLSGTVIILAGVLLNICVFSSLFRQPKIYNTDCDKDHEDDRIEDERKKLTLNESIQNITINEEQNTMIIEEHEPEQNSEMDCVVSKMDTCPPPPIITYVDRFKHDLEQNDFKKCLGKSDNHLFGKFQSSQFLSTKLHSTDNLSKRRLNHLSMHSVYGQFSNKNEKIPSHQSTCLYSDIGTNSYLTVSISRLMKIHHLQFASSHQLQTGLHQSRQSFLQIPTNIENSNGKEFKENSAKDNLPSRDLQYCASHRSLHSNAYCESFVSRHEDLPSMIDMIPEPLGYSIGELLKKVSFHLFYIGACLIQFGYPVPGVFLADLAASHGIPSHHGALMISLIGSFNVGGRLLAGFLANLRSINPIRLNNVAMLFASVLCLLCPFFTSMWSLCLFAALYGFFLVHREVQQQRYYGTNNLALMVSWEYIKHQWKALKTEKAFISYIIGNCFQQGFCL